MTDKPFGEGKEFADEVASVTRTTTEDSINHLQGGYTWQPSVYRLRPLIGLAALLCTIACLCWSLGILIGSNGAPTKSWYFQPTVYLAIATAISNMSLQCALVQASPISWWNKALRGSTIRDLELEYEAGQSLLRAIYKSLRQGRLVGPLIIASFASTLVVIDGPLLQRSSSVELATVRSLVNLNFSVSPEIPRHFSGFHGPQKDGYEIYSWTEDIAKAVLKGDSIQSPVECEGVCTFKVQGPGLVKQACHQNIWKITSTILQQKNVSWGTSGLSKKPTPMLLFQFQFGATSPGPEPLNLYSGYLDLTDGEGHYFENNCTFISGIVEYHFKMQDGILSFETPASSSREIAVANNTYYDYCKPGTSPVQLTPFALVFLVNYVMDGQIDLDHHTFAVSESTITPAMADYGVFSGNPDHHGSIHVEDPMPDMISNFDELLLRAGLMSASWSNTTDWIDPGLQLYQVFQANSTKQENVFHSDLRWFAGAATVQILAIMLILPVFWGWWKVGVDLSLSPFHIAKIFGSPVLGDVSSAAGTSVIVKEVGTRRVKLGVVNAKSRSGGMQVRNEDSTQNGQLRVDEQQYVIAPRSGDRFRS